MTNLARGTFAVNIFTTWGSWSAAARDLAGIAATMTILIADGKHPSGGD